MLNDRESEVCTQIERDFLRTLEGGCTAPIGALAKVEGSIVHFSGGLYSLKGSEAKTIEAEFPIGEAKDKGKSLGLELLRSGGDALMKEFKAAHE